MTIPWILIAIVILLILLAVIAVYMTSEKKREPNYYAFFWMGLIWLAIGLPMDNWPMWSLGLVFFIAGLVNKDKWEKNQVKWKDLNKKEKNVRLLIIAMLGAMVVAGLIAFLIMSENVKNAKLQCTSDIECETPMEYLVQSNCPFGSACINNECKVVCPLTFHDPNPAISKSYPYECKSDSDCNCEERGDRSLGCVCHRGTCVSVEG